jgi:hypothetical protein
MIRLVPNVCHTPARCGSRVRFHKGHSWLEPHALLTSPAIPTTSPARGAAPGAAPRRFYREQRLRKLPRPWRGLIKCLDLIVRIILAACLFPVLLILIVVSNAGIVVIACDSFVRGRVKAESTLQCERVGLEIFRS